MSLDLAPGTGGPRWLRRVLWSLLIAAGVYTLVRAVTLTVDTYDSHVYLYNASRLLGSPLPPLDDSRPWLLSVLHMPTVAFARLFGPATTWLLRAPHLLNAAISLGAVAALVALMRQVLPSWLALLGGVLFVSNRCFIHYGANVLTDLGVTGLCVLSLTLHLQAVKTRRMRWFVLAGVAFGLAICMKFTAPTFAITIAAVELGALIQLQPVPGRRFGRPRFHFDKRRALGVGLEVLAGVAVVAVLEVFVFTRLYGGRGWARFQAAWATAQNLRSNTLPGESWRDNLHMAVATFSPWLLLLAAAGVVVALARPRRDDLPFAACLVGVGGALLFAIGHNEARYLLPVAPGVIYFALRASEAAWAATRVRAGLAAAGAAGLLVLGSLANGAAQVAQDHDPFFGREFHGRATRALAAARPPGRPAFVMGYWQTLTPAAVGPVPQDEFWNTYHASPFVTEYLLGEPVKLLPGHAGKYDAALDLMAHTVDGDALVRFNDVFFMTAGFPKGPRDQALEVWKIHRRELAPSGPAGHFGPAPGSPPDSGQGELRVEDGATRFSPRLAGGPWIMFGRRPDGGWTFIGESSGKPGETWTLPAPVAATDRIALLRVDISRFD